MNYDNWKMNKFWRYDRVHSKNTNRKFLSYKSSSRLCATLDRNKNNSISFSSVVIFVSDSCSCKIKKIWKKYDNDIFYSKLNFQMKYDELFEYLYFYHEIESLIREMIFHCGNWRYAEGKKQIKKCFAFDWVTLETSLLIFQNTCLVIPRTVYN